MIQPTLNTATAAPAPPRAASHRLGFREGKPAGARPLLGCLDRRLRGVLRGLQALAFRAAGLAFLDVVLAFVVSHRGRTRPDCRPMPRGFARASGTEFVRAIVKIPADGETPSKIDPTRGRIAGSNRLR